MIHMSQYMNRELILFAQAFWHGVVLMMAYDCLRILRRVIPHGKMLTAVEDLFYWVCGALYLFACLYRENSGMLRGYLFIGVVLGMGAWYLSLSTYFVRYLSELLLFIKKVIKRLKTYLIRGKISLCELLKKRRPIKMEQGAGYEKKKIKKKKYGP